mmetsp:Transcript_17759/g.17460  ORF Transcript_17759/g.17460 Transcript_17759/m.17460 type:complete len:143 (+) Transcript_17759:1356-1784(+)
MVRISKNLNKIVNAFEIVKLLKGLQGKYNKVSTQSSSQDKINERIMELLEDLNSKVNKMQGDVTSQGFMIKHQHTIRLEGDKPTNSRESARLNAPDGASIPKKNSIYLNEINEIMKEADTLNISRAMNNRKLSDSREENKND